MNQEQQCIAIAKEYDQTRPAFPCPPVMQSNGFYSNGNCITIREYAAIKLRVPDSGVPWLDEMITKANRDYFAAAALQGNLASQSIEVGYYDGKDSWNKAAEDAYRAADAMIKAREEQP